MMVALADDTGLAGDKITSDAAAPRPWSTAAPSYASNGSDDGMHTV
jgi:hypothetical protein